MLFYFDYFHEKMPCCVAEAILGINTLKTKEKTPISASNNMLEPKQAHVTTTAPPNWTMSALTAPDWLPESRAPATRADWLATLELRAKTGRAN